jgi:hypothetical protein
VLVTLLPLPTVNNSAALITLLDRYPNRYKRSLQKTIKSHRYLKECDRLFWHKQQKILKIIGNTGVDFDPSLVRFSRTKCNGSSSPIVTISASRIVTSYLGIKFTKPSRYSLHRYSYFPKHDRYQRVEKCAHLVPIKK